VTVTPCKGETGADRSYASKWLGYVKSKLTLFVSLGDRGRARSQALRFIESSSASERLELCDPSEMIKPEGYVTRPAACPFFLSYEEEGKALPAASRTNCADHRQIKSLHGML
jgi:hypothetical protein